MIRLLGIAALLALLPAAASGDDELVEGRPAPAFTLRTLNPDACGLERVGLDRYVGPEAQDAGAKIVLLSFFASWCGPCRKEMPYLEQLQEMYREQGLRIVSISIDRDEAGIAEAKRMAAAAKLSYPLVSDRFNFLARRYLGNESPLPSIFIVGREGTVVRIEKGYGRDASSFLLAEVQRALGIGGRSAAAEGSRN